MTQVAITYRPLCESDFDAMFAIASKYEVVRNLGSYPWPADPDFVRKRCRPYGGNGFVWGIVAETGLVGTISVTEGELGYMLHPDAQGRGIISNAILDALTQAFTKMNLPQVHADIWADNAVSKHLLKKNGFKLTVEETVHVLARGEPTASETYVLKRECWIGQSAPQLTTQRLVLRSPDRRDTDTILRVVGNYEVSKWLSPVPHPYTEKDADDFFAAIKRKEMGTIWAIELEGDCVGMISIGPSMGYWLDPDHWGKGLTTEAARAVVDHWFTSADREELQSYHFVGNIGSQSVLTRCGFEDTGPRTAHSLARGEDVPARQMLLTRDRWQTLRAGPDWGTAFQTPQTKAAP